MNKTVTLKLAGKPNTPEAQKLVYELTTEYMHGDADGDTFNQNYYELDEVDKLKLFLLALQDIDGRCDYREIAKDVFIAQGKDEDDADDLAEEFSDAFYEGDMACEGEAASLTGITLHWYDEEGRQYNVDVVIK